MMDYVIFGIVGLVVVYLIYKKTQEKKSDKEPTKPKPKPKPKDHPTLPSTVLVKPDSDSADRGLTILLPRSQAGQYQPGSGYIIDAYGKRHGEFYHLINHHEHGRDIFYTAVKGFQMGESAVVFWNGNGGYRFNPNVRSGS